MAGPNLAGLLIRLHANAGEPFAATALDGVKPLSELGFGPIEPLFDLPADNAGGFEMAAAPPAKWFHAPLEATSETTPWDLVHEAMAEILARGPAAGEVYVEPDLEQPFLTTAGQEGLSAGDGKDVVDPPDRDLPFRDEFAWFLDDEFSQLRRAREMLQHDDGEDRVRIAHLDTGYDENHSTLPPHLRTDLQHNFVAGEAAGDARDPGRDVPGPFDNPGHGTGTLGILAGGRVDPLDDFLGGAPDADVVPVRIAKSVILLRTSALAKALDYVASGGPAGAPLADVVSLSMGGLASRSWADAVNKAYEAGVCMVSAAGNNLSTGAGGFPTRFIVYPARFRRVIAACGVMADRRPYYGLPFGKLQGNWGPTSKMATALAAFTPNLPWAELGSPEIIDLDGAGTSSATPQIAAAAALWMAKHRAALAQCGQPWQRVEAVRHALFSSAEKTADGGRSDRLGNGILRAARALAVGPVPNLAKTPRDSASFAFLRLFSGLGLTASPHSELLAVEATQLAQQEVRAGEPNLFEEILPDPDLPPSAIPAEQQRRFVQALIDHPRASRALKRHLEATYQELYGTIQGPPRRQPKEAERPTTPKPPPAGPASGAAEATARARYVVDPPHRRLRGYALDPSLAQKLGTAPISTVTFSVPWEELAPGPIGEYLEVVDYDPASKCFYEPVDLNDPRLLAQDGLQPSEGSPQFHQQMVYAVASLTIHNFERALGRKALWAPGPPPPGAHRKNDSHFVQRLRIYPHALRTPNAYYSPARKALLFGYYSASADAPGEHMPQGRVFTCLSHDIVAHETTHALLDGMHRRFIFPSNPDVLAFHEAFADIVALFQHFTLPEIVRHQMAKTRGDIRSQRNLLGELAGEFGRTSGRGEALRSAIGARDRRTGIWHPHVPDPTEIDSVFDPHPRGAILVAAVFDAFFSIYESRIADLLRLATGGTGELQPGALPPDLVHRLSDEASKAARHVLAMCVRALDYCPPVDLTFGEYLRAILTADCDLVRDDDRDYRVAFVEAFRRRGLYPSGIRTLSVESLQWSRPENDEFRPSQQLNNGIENVRRSLREQTVNGSREQVFRLARELRRGMHEWLTGHFSNGAGKQDARFLGLDPKKKLEVHSLRLAHRVGPDGNLLNQVIVDILQETKTRLDPSDRGSRMMTVEGGCTIVADLETLAIQYCIRKNGGSLSRVRRQREYLTRFGLGSLHATYFDPDAEREPVARLHAGSV